MFKVNTFYEYIMFFILIVTVVYTLYSVSDARSSNQVKSNDIWVGDSRFVGMSVYCKENYLCKVGKGYSWIKNKKIKEEVIIFNLGVNDLGNVDKYIKLLNKLCRKHEVYFVSVNPVDVAKAKRFGYSVTNKQIVAFNRKIRVKTNCKYIDTYSELKEKGFGTSDGIHYTARTYKKIHKIIKSSIEGGY